jgi:2Fe-2S ferredoxin
MDSAGACSIMVSVIYKSRSGAQRQVEVEENMSLMEGAVLNAVDGIEGICGGICSCGTCHVRVGAAWRERLPEPGLSERLKLQQLDGCEPDSRLACQLVAGPAIDGIVVTVVNS